MLIMEESVTKDDLRQFGLLLLDDIRQVIVTVAISKNEQDLPQE